MHRQQRLCTGVPVRDMVNCGDWIVFCHCSLTPCPYLHATRACIEGASSRYQSCQVNGVWLVVNLWLLPLKEDSIITLYTFHLEFVQALSIVFIHHKNVPVLVNLVPMAFNAEMSV